MKLGELRPAVEKKDRKRLGRGIGSGNGKTAGKGHKGQTPLYRRLPKRGFTNRNSKNYTEVTLTMLNKSKATDVTAESLVEEGIIGKINDGIVVLATGKLEKKLNVKANRFTATAKEKIEALGGKAEVI